MKVPEIGLKYAKKIFYLNKLLNKNFSKITYELRIKDNEFKKFIDYHFYGEYPLKINIEKVGTFKNFKKQLIASSIVRETPDDKQILELLDELISIEEQKNSEGMQLAKNLGVEKDYSLNFLQWKFLIDFLVSDKGFKTYILYKDRQEKIKDAMNLYALKKNRDEKYVKYAWPIIDKKIKDYFNNVIVKDIRSKTEEKIKLDASQIKMLSPKSRKETIKSIKSFNDELIESIKKEIEKAEDNPSEILKILIKYSKNKMIG